MDRVYFLCLVSLLASFCGHSNCQVDDEFLYDTFPNGFLWGFSTSAYQSEGAWNIDGKGLNIWDTWTKINDGENIADGSNGDVACDSYHKYHEDIRILKEMNANTYRLSISWSRILPNANGSTSGHGLNQMGVDFYNRFLDALLENGITPFVTMYHWDLPQGLQDIGGWPNEILAEEFATYATVLFTEFGDRVKHWITINEPWNSCFNAYGDGAIAPGIKEPAELPYQCGHTIIKAHALAYRVYESQFKQQQQGQVGLSFSADWTEPKNPNNPDDVEAALRSRLFTLGWFAHPLFKGDYPQVMRQLIDEKSQQEGRNSSRLPTFNSTWISIINGSVDFFGLNHYTSVLVSPSSGGPPGIIGDADTEEEFDPSWEETFAPWLRIVPFGMRRLVTWISQEYNNPPIYVTENGAPDSDGTEDTQRIRYYRSYINELLKAVKLDGADVRGYIGWSLMDVFGMPSGYRVRWGAYYINRSDPLLTRIPKDSSFFLAKVFNDNGFPNTTRPVDSFIDY